MKNESQNTINELNSDLKIKLEQIKQFEQQINELTENNNSQSSTINNLNTEMDTKTKENEKLKKVMKYFIVFEIWLCKDKHCFILIVI